MHSVTESEGAHRSTRQRSFTSMANCVERGRRVEIIGTALYHDRTAYTTQRMHSMHSIGTDGVGVYEVDKGPPKRWAMWMSFAISLPPVSNRLFIFLFSFADSITFYSYSLYQFRRSFPFSWDPYDMKPMESADVDPGHFYFEGFFVSLNFVRSQFRQCLA